MPVQRKSRPSSVPALPGADSAIEGTVASPRDRAADLATLSDDELVTRGQQARAKGAAAMTTSQWELGDLAAEVDTRHRDGHGLQDYAESIDVAYMTLVRYRTVAKAYPACIP